MKRLKKKNSRITIEENNKKPALVKLRIIDLNKCNYLQGVSFFSLAITIISYHTETL